MNDLWDEAALAHLESARTAYADAGVIDFLRKLVGEVWKQNRARWSPEEHFDDTNVLGYQTSRNVNNRIVATVEEASIAPGVRPEMDTGIALLGLGGFRLRVVKSPIDRGLTPDFLSDFDWSTSATRESAARRNSSAYYPFSTPDWTLTYDGDPRPRDRRDVSFCRDLFLLWAGDLGSDRTAGWIGLPRVGDVPWMAVVALWADTDEPNGSAPESSVREDDD
ncbi:MAG: hypothetical protein NTV23_04205 [Propionibacteriales bacterium]|nr:hypothetical protein [Propionibacteriales bacterium]